ncbi:MAG: hypothetical protein IPP14_10250 [Planctomycetes bacterium]|nr:hypothetical protein [Planctomycetota bacterium]
MRALLLALLLLACPLTAQATGQITTHYVGAGYGWVFIFQLDHGAAPAAANLTLNLTTASTSGMRARVVDADAKATQGTHTEATATLAGAGSLVLSFLTDVRPGSHPIVVVVQPLTAGQTVFSGALQSDIGSLTGAATQYVNGIQEGLFIPQRLYAAFNRVIDTQSTFSTTLELDFGASARPATFNFEGSGSGLTEIRIYDVTDGNTLLQTLVAPPSGNLATMALVTTTAHSGLMNLRVEVQGNGSAGSVFWAVWLTDGIEVTGATGDGVPTLGTGSKGGGGGGGCVAGSAGVAPCCAIVVGLLLIARHARRRRIGHTTAAL